MKLQDLFRTCWYGVVYREAGDDVDYAFVEQGDTLFIYFEGSNSITDWVRNFVFPKRPYKDMNEPYKVHRGFLAAWKEVEGIIIKKITEQVPVVVFDAEKNKNKLVTEYKFNKIISIGYSHGGALSGFCHECCWFNRPDIRANIYGVGFEAPRFFGAWSVKEELKERWAQYIVVRDNKDLVTHAPPALFRFCHVGKVLKISGDRKLIKHKYIPNCIKDHYPQVVLAGLEKADLMLEDCFK